jgi:hypothetical protein
MKCWNGNSLVYGFGVLIEKYPIVCIIQNTKYKIEIRNRVNGNKIEEQ